MNEYMDIACGAARWIDSLRHDTEHGAIWGLAQEKAESYVANLYTGSAGITIFYLELYDATKDSRYLQQADAAGLELLQRIQSYGELPCAPMGGWLGYMFAFAELASAKCCGCYFGVASAASDIYSGAVGRVYAVIIIARTLPAGFLLRARRYS